MSEVQTTYPKSSKLTVAQMEKRLNNDESLFRRLTALGHTDDETLCTFDHATSAPPHQISLRKADDPPAGDEICTGSIWIEGNEQSVKAYRRST